MSHEGWNASGLSGRWESAEPVANGATSAHLYRDFDFGAATEATPPEPPPTPIGVPADGDERIFSSYWGGREAETAPPSAAENGRTRFPEVPGYEILSELGRGGMGVVYKARQCRLNKLVALKMILAGDHAGADALARLLSEAETIARIQHPNIVQVFAIGDCDGRPYVELELVEGGSLAARLEGTPWPPRAAARLVESIAHGVSAAHRVGVVHRDLKPANILMTDEGQPKISDFGLAKSIEKNSGLTRTESILGSPSYMAPEQAEGRAKDVGPAADVYAVGANLYELLTGRPPFVGSSLLATLELVRNAEPVPPRRLQPGLARDLETICLKCLQKEPAKRYESADALAEDLAAFLDGEPIKARPTTQWERGLKWVRRYPSTAALIAVTILAIVGTAVGWNSRQAERNRQRIVAQRRIDGLRGQTDHLVLLGKEAIRRHDWEGARIQLSSALALIRTEPRLAETRAAVGKLLGFSDQKILEQKRRESDRARYAEFLRLYDEAVFYQSDYTGLDPDANLKASRSAASRALNLFALNRESAGKPSYDLAHFDKAERETIVSNAYELTLLLAEATSKPLTGEDPVRQAREALGILDHAASLRTPTAAFHLRRATYLEHLGDRRAASEEQNKVNQVIGSDESSVDDFLVGEQAYRNQEYKRAIAAFRHALVLRPDHFWAQYLLAICNLKTHRAAEAQASFIACQSERPTFVWAYLLKGFAEGEMGEFDLAEADFQRATELGLNDQERYVMLVNRGVLRIRRGQNQTAIDDLKTAIAIKPDQFQAYINLAQAYENLKRWDEALETLNQSIARAPGQAVLHRARSRIHRLRGRNEEALDDLERAIRLSAADDPMLVSDHLERGLILQQAGRYKEALAACDQALALRPDRPDIHRLRGVVLVGLKRYDDAIHSFDVCIARGNRSASLYEARGLALSWRGSYARAIADYTLALALEPRNGSLYENRGWAYLSSGAAELALRDFNEALRLDPRNAHVLSGRALAQVQLRRPREAVADARAAARLAPGDARQLYNAARVFSQAAACLEANPAQVPGGWALARQYRTEAMDLITRTLDALPEPDRAGFWAQVVRTDTALDPVRRARIFLELDARVSHPAGAPALSGGPHR